MSNCPIAVRSTLINNRRRLHRLRVDSERTVFLSGVDWRVQADGVWFVPQVEIRSITLLFGGALHGLARALEETSRSRQVIVFTHDERLFEAVRRLNIICTTLSVTRRSKSVVEIQRPLIPCGRTSKPRSRSCTPPISRKTSSDMS